MKKNGSGKRFLLFFLTAAIVLHMQELPALAETLELQKQLNISKELPGTSDTPEEPGTSDVPGSSRTSNTADIPGTGKTPNTTDEPDTTGKPDTADEPDAAGEPDTTDGLDTTDTPGIPEALADDDVLVGAPGADDDVMTAAELTDAELENHIRRGVNPEQATVNLFDYWNTDDETDGDLWDYPGYILAEKGISQGHLLRFGPTREKDDDGTPVEWEYGAWNKYSLDKPYQGIVKNILDNGYPKLNLSNLSDEALGAYKDSQFFEEEQKEESLEYLFSVSSENNYKKAYPDVQGLFQVDEQGYYYYDSKKNFASLNEDETRFILYDSPGVGTAPDQDTGAQGNYGEFFPFNTAEQVFDYVYDTTDGQHPYPLTYIDKDNQDPDSYVVDEKNGSFLACTDKALNHYLGMTLEVPFLQPEGGRLPGNIPMSFEFSGDDDVWIFIDDVLVADLGGIHDAYSVDINFATGVVEIPSLGTDSKRYLREIFEEAYSGSEIGGFHGNTFADHTVHTLKMFYLERGHMASNLSLRFNIQIARYNQVKKVDQDGDTIGGVEFALYPAQAYSQSGTGRIECTSTVSGNRYYVAKSSDQKLLSFTTSADGIAEFIDQATNSGYSFSRSPTNFYILEETSAPAGYRSQPVDIVLEFNPSTAMLSVANRWQTGAYASFTSYVNEWAGRGMSYGEYQAGNIVAGSQTVSEESRENGLVLAVPLLKNQNSVWFPLYGSNIGGFHTTGSIGDTADSMERALLEAALNQCNYEAGWYLTWSDAKASLEGRLTDLPGRADRYQHVNPEKGDMRMVYIIIEPDVLKNLGITGSGSAQKYEALKRYVEAKGVSQAVTDIYGSPGTNNPQNRNVNLLDTSQFMRIFRSLIYIPNEQRELRVKKVDKNGIPINGVTFGIFKTEDDARQKRNPVAQGETATVIDKNNQEEDGILIFKPQPEGKGYAEMVWADAVQTTYYLCEISAPSEYKVNDTIIPIVIGTYSVYADAGVEGDGVSVEAGVGQLCQTMVKYATDGDVDITLRDITIIGQKQASNAFQLDGWSSDQSQKKDLHYGINSEMDMDYGLHDNVSEDTSFFRTDTGYLRTKVVQNESALKEAIYGEASGNGNWTSLGDTDLTGLFSLLNVVVVEDRPVSEDQRELIVRKVDQNGQSVSGAVFGLYNSIEDAQNNENAAASGITANVNGQEGILIFAEQDVRRDGCAQISWKDSGTPYKLYLKEISAPRGYLINDTIIPVIVEEHSVYADAGIEEDGVSVMAGVGCLRREETQYADDSGVSLTLRDITASAQLQASDAYDSNRWKDVPEDTAQKVDLHYGLNKEMGMDYGVHDIDTETPYFIAETGFIRTRVAQNTEELREGIYHDKEAETAWDDLSGDSAKITEWFSQLNIVVVENEKTQNPDDPDEPDNTSHGSPDGSPEDDPDGGSEDDSPGGFLGSLVKKIKNADPDTNVISILDTLQNRIDSPQTGDHSLIWLWASLGLASLLGIGVAVRNLIRREKGKRKTAPEEKAKEKRKAAPEEKAKEKRKTSPEEKAKEKRKTSPEEKVKEKRKTSSEEKHQESKKSSSKAKQKKRASKE